jgi:HlyD family secretion protein
VLVELVDSLLLAQMELSKADLMAAEAGLALVKSGARKETLDHAHALVRQAEAAQEAARVAWEDAQVMVGQPQELELKVSQARAQLRELEIRERQAKAMADAAQAGRDLAEEVVAMLEDFPITVEIPVAPGQIVRRKVNLPPDVLPNARYEQALATYQSWQAWTGHEQASTAQAGAERYLMQLEEQKANPLALQAHADRAGAEYEIAMAAVGVAQAQVEGLGMGATPQQIMVAEAQVDMARAALETLKVQRDKFALLAPISGLVLERPVHVGEVALPGMPLLTLADLGNVTLTVYVPEDQLGSVQLGQPVLVTVDAYPDRTFRGRVTNIASEAEFTPKNVQTREERVNMVFAVKIELPNLDQALKPGMPADAVIGTPDGE